MRISRSSYQGCEEDVLALRNRNRGIKATRSFLDWRYEGEKTQRPPDILWVENSDGLRVGMAGIIYRPYWVNGCIRQVAVLGDISLDEAFRGHGVGLRLFEEISAYIRTQDIYCALVIPTPAALKSLIKAGWCILDQFVWYVWFTDPVKVLSRWKLFPRAVSPVASRLWLRVLHGLVQRIDTKDLCAEVTNDASLSFDHLWSATSKEGSVLRDRSADNLNWRFRDYPRESFGFTRYLSNGRMIGYIVFLRDHDDCIVYDFLVLGKHWVRPVIARFLVDQLKISTIRSVRIKLNAGHPYREEMEGIRGYVRRKEEYVLADRVQNIDGARHTWFLTSADKDS